MTMCGICGQVSCDRRQQINEDLIHRMADVIAYRGPDESGVYVNGHVGLGHRRLSIIDLSTGQQPMSNARQDLWLVYNGEIYNFRELRQDLEKRGYRFNTTSDTEVLIHLYDEYGTACVNELRGMFAFAIWDVRRQRLFLARDRIGQKPLFYRETDDCISFASEIKSLLQDPAYSASINLTAMHHYLTYQYIPPPDTMFQGILKLPPAHTLVYEGGKTRVERYWDLRYIPKVQMNEHDMEEHLDALIHESVKLRMISDVPIGAFLSGGIDSSLIVAIMSQYADKPVKTFSIGFQEDEFNELPYAQVVAQRYNTEHHEYIVEPDAVDILPKLVWHFDEPFGDSSAIPTYYVSQMTSQHVKVALNGDGGDESFAGYLRYLGYTFGRYYQRIPKIVRTHGITPFLALFNPEGNSLPPALRKNLRRLKFLNDLSQEPRERQYARFMTIFPNALKTELYCHEVAQQFHRHDSLEYMFEYFHTDHTDHFTDAMLFSDVMTYLPGALLVKVDRTTMAHSLEGRSPFLDHILMEFAASLPANSKLHGTTLKFLLKKIGAKWLPQQILSRRKQGFGVPLERWFRHELRDMVHDTLASSAFVQAGIFKQAVIDRIIHEHHTGIQRHQYRIWLLLNLELWYRMFILHE